MPSSNASGLGARPADIGQTGEEPWRVLTDPEGNAFCLLRTPSRPALMGQAGALVRARGR